MDRQSDCVRRLLFWGVQVANHRARTIRNGHFLSG